MKKVSCTPLPIKLTETEETILFMILYGYSLNKIAKFLKFSNYYLKYVIVKSLFKKFEIKTRKTKDLMVKAMSMGYALIVPERFLPQLSEKGYLLSR